MNHRLPTLNGRFLPHRIDRLRELAYNLWWSWHEEALELYRQLDPLLWETVGHNPVAFLRRVDSSSLEAAIGNATYMAIYNRVFRAFDVYMGEHDTWFAATYPGLKEQQIAYLSTEYGMHESLPLYAGGLGVLSGDHTKEAGDLGLPFVGLGLLYHEGYFTQKINAEGWQEDFYDVFDPEDRPIQLAHMPNHETAQITLELNGLRISSTVWHVQVGRVPVFLLDTALESSDPDLTRDVSRLYGGSRTTRLLQEVLLGIGGVRALQALGIQPQIWHMNEGHSAFCALELLRQKVEQGLSFEQAVEEVRVTSVFTTHTPVPAGLDMFDLEEISHYFQGYWEKLGLTQERFLDLARQDIGWGEKFSMPRLALRLSSRHNGVSNLHGQVSRELFHHVWPDRRFDNVPIFHITNGIHAKTWLAPEMAALFDQYIGYDWIRYMDEPALWNAVDAIPDDALWDIRCQLKLDLFRFLIRQAQRRWAMGETTPAHVVWSGALLADNALTIGFARRFATYKRATLLFQDIEQLKRLVNDSERPVQFVFAGKAHPQDQGGKSLIQEICHRALDSELAGRIAFLENYDMCVARYLVRGVDVWLNNPRRPREASGTSGQKAALNGIPNLSILDGWWAEGYNGRNGWAIGDGHRFSDEREQDRADADELYRTLEKEVVPLYYARSEDGLPRAWLAKVREAIKSAAPHFTARRMVKEYTRRSYMPALQQETGERQGSGG